jgi:hypothetical protein
VDSEGQPILVIDAMAMPRQDADDLLMSRTKVEEIMRSNKGRNLPWSYAMEANASKT